MENIQSKDSIEKAPRASVATEANPPTTIPVRVSREVDEELVKIASRASKHGSGRKVKKSAVIAALVKRVDEALVSELAEGTMTTRDRMEQAWQDYKREKGAVSFESFQQIMLESFISAPKRKRQTSKSETAN